MNVNVRINNLMNKALRNFCHHICTMLLQFLFPIMSEAVRWKDDNQPTDESFRSSEEKKDGKNGYLPEKKIIVYNKSSR